jgi:hypothetical protein
MFLQSVLIHDMQFRVTGASAMALMDFPQNFHSNSFHS